MSNPIYYSDLIKPDGSIDEAIRKLESLKNTYEELANTIVKQATVVNNELNKVTSSTEAGRKATSKSVDEASRLESAYNELAFAISETGAKVVELKTLTNDTNKQHKLTAEYVNAADESYDQLKAQLGILVDRYKAMTKEQALNTAEGQKTLQQILQIKTQLAEIDRLMKINTKTQTEQSKASKTQKQVLTDLEKAKLKLAKASSQENIELAKLANATREQTRINKLNAIISSEAAGSYNALSAQYSLNKIQINKLTEAQRTQTFEGKQLVAQTEQIYQQMIRMQEATGKHTLSVGNYAKAWNGLDISVSQIVRELPAAAVSLNTFFLGISNNVPIFVDEVKKLRAQNALAAAEGKAQVSVWKSVTKSFLGFNTVLVLILTAFSLYGKDIIEWIGNLFKSEKALTAAAAAQENFNDAMEEGSKSAQAELVRLKILYDATQDVTRSKGEHEKAIEALKKAYPDYFKDLTNEAILAGKASEQYIALAKSILAAAKARAAEDKITENFEKIIELQLKKADKVKSLTEQAGGPGRSSVVFIGAQGLKEIDKEIAELQEANQKLLKFVNVGDLLFGEGGSGKTPKEQADETLKLLRANTDATIELLDDEFTRRSLEIKTQYDREINDLRVKLSTDKNLTETGRQAINDLIINLEKLKNKELESLDQERLDQLDQFSIDILKAERDQIRSRLEVAQEGSENESKLRIQLLKKNQEIELRENARLAEDTQQTEASIRAKYRALIDQEERDYLYESGLRELEIKQEFDESEFNLIKRTERQKTIFRLQQEKERWVKILELLKQGLKNVSDVEIETIQNIIKSIDREISEGGFTDRDRPDIYSLLGLNVDKNTKDAIDEVFQRTLDHLGEVADAYVRLADIAVESAEKRVDAAQKVLDAEIEARNNGYAFNVSQAQKDLALAKASQEKALRQRERAQRAQSAIDTITQTSSLITASANIWSSFSGLGPFGPGLAIAALLTMWGSFAAAKVKAAQVTRAENELYADGGFELLQGGSHASGNDIPLGKTKSGKNRKAEGGEALAIINKRNTKKYGSLIPHIVDSLNKGIFEKRYSSMHSGNVVNNVTHVGMDLKTLESDVSAIRKQNKRRHFINERGEAVEIYKNLKTIHHAN